MSRDGSKSLRPALTIIAVATTASLCAACGVGGAPRHGAMVPVAATAEGATRVPILVATTRQPLSDDPATMFGGERAQAVSYAAITVSIPPGRKIGEIQWPTAAPGDPNKNFVTASASVIDERGFRSALSSAVKQTGRRKALVFVHGFNNQFDEAVYRLAQITHDASSPAIPILFTWPSRGSVELRSYTYDRESANYSRDALEQLLDMIVNDPAITEVDVVAHSMGNWVTLEALRSRSIRAQSTSRARSDKLRNAALIAPDVDVDVFRTQIRRMGANRPRISLFVAQDDGALGLSKTLWGGVPRLGEINPEVEPYRSEFERDRILVFDLTKLRDPGDNPHSRAFGEDITTVVAMFHDRINAEQTAARRGAGPTAQASAR